MKALIKQIIDLFVLLGLVILLLAAGRAFFLFIHYDSFSAFTSFDLFSAFYKGFLYDLEIILAINILFILLFIWPSRIYNSIFYQGSLKLLFFVVNVGALLINLLDIKVFDLIGHRLRAYEFRHELTLLYRKLAGLNLNNFISEYLSLSIVFIAFVLILWFSLRYIKKRIWGELKGLQTVRRIIGFVVLGAFAVLSYYSYLDKSDWLSGLYSQADRKLVPLMINNPYLLIRSTNCKELNDADDWDFGTYDSEKQYITLNAEVPESIKLVILDNVGAGFIELDSAFSDKNVKNHEFYSFQGNHESIFKILDETLLSFPSIFEDYFYKTIYSLNSFENLVGLLQKSGYSVLFSNYGFDKKSVQIIKHFYGFENQSDNSNLSTKGFELVLINGKNESAQSIEKLLDGLSTEFKGKKSLLIAIENNDLSNEKQANLTKDLKIYSSLQLPTVINTNNSIVQLLDIKPTILNLINYQEPFISYGSSWFVDDKKIILQSDAVDDFKLLKDSILLINADNETESLKLLKNMTFSNEDYKDSLAVERIVLENKLHSILTDYKKRLVNNELR